MNDAAKQWQSSLRICLNTISSHIRLDQNHIFVIGCSSSEVIGEKIGTAGSEDAAKALYEVFTEFKKDTGVHLAFQSCEHINRALVIERETARAFRLEEVTAIPHRKAGGAMSTHAYEQFSDPVVVEHIKADAGIDIGDTFIGMHLKHVAVPIRSEVKSIGNAHVTMAKTRPKLIGGTRAKYPE
ncbi:TIGR01440 family protein [Alteribacillus sp. JSM 102045]|uniref:TIGR01440 family protein n=1 Tax=Alteribacillus sp. JSM 102045 TaxID=1562101 RepID=UPI0035C01164